MNCKNIHINISGYIENTLSADSRAAMNDHLDHCGDCRLLLQNVMATYSVFDQGLSPTPSPFFITRIEHAIANKEKIKSVTPVFAIRWMPVAASLLLFIAIGTGIYVGKNLSTNLSGTQKYTSSEMGEAYASEYDSNSGVALENIFYNE